MIACTIYLMIEHKEKLLSLDEKLLSVDHSSNRGESTLNTNLLNESQIFWEQEILSFLL